MKTERTTTEGELKSVPLTSNEARLIVFTSLKNKLTEALTDGQKKTPEERSQVYQEITDEILEFGLTEKMVKDLVWEMASFEAPLRMRRMVKDFCRIHDLTVLGEVYSQTEPDALDEIVKSFPDKAWFPVRVQAIFPVRTDQWLEPLLLRRELGFDSRRQEAEAFDVLGKYVLFGANLFGRFTNEDREKMIAEEMKEAVQIVVKEWHLPVGFRNEAVQAYVSQLATWIRETPGESGLGLLEFANVARRAAVLTDLSEIDWSGFGKTELAKIFLGTIGPLRNIGERWIRSDLDPTLVYYFSGLRQWLKLTGVEEKELVEEILGGLGDYQKADLFISWRLIEEFVPKDGRAERKIELIESAWINRLIKPMSLARANLLSYLAYQLGRKDLGDRISTWTMTRDKPKWENLVETAKATLREKTA
jgi:hypothetical protein